MSQPNFFVSPHIHDTEAPTEVAPEKKEERFYQTRLFKVAVGLQLLTIWFFVSLSFPTSNSPPKATHRYDDDDYSYYRHDNNAHPNNWNTPVRVPTTATEYMVLAVSTFWDTYKVGIVMIAIGAVFLTAIASGLAMYLEQKRLSKEATEAASMVVGAPGQEELAQLQQQLEQGESAVGEQPVSAMEEQALPTEEPTKVQEPETLWSIISAMDRSDLIASVLTIYGVALMFTVQVVVLLVMSGAPEPKTAPVRFSASFLFALVTLQIICFALFFLLDYLRELADNACKAAKARSFGMFLALLIKFLLHLSFIFVGIFMLPFLLVLKWSVNPSPLEYYLRLFAFERWAFYWTCFKDGPLNIYW